MAPLNERLRWLRRRKTRERLLAEASDWALLTTPDKTIADAFSVLYRRHYEAVLTSLSNRTRDTAMALDLLIEVFATAYLERTTFHTKDESALPWLLSIATVKAAGSDHASCRKLGIPKRGYTDRAIAQADALIAAKGLL
jgi:hypothetical protein